MKLKKREITLNEADSLKDVFYLEKTLEEGYKREVAFRKETEHEIRILRRETEEARALVHTLWKKSVEASL